MLFSITMHLIWGLYDKFMDFCCYFVICLLIFKKFTDKYNFNVLNEKLVGYW